MFHLFILIFLIQGGPEDFLKMQALIPFLKDVYIEILLTLILARGAYIALASSFCLLFIILPYYLLL